MRKSIASVSISGTLREKMEAAAAAGFHGFEIFENDLLSFDGSAADVRALAEELDLSILLLQPFRDFEGMPEPFRSRNFDRAERKFDLMEQLGTELLLVCSNVSPQSLGGIRRAADDFHELGVRAAKRGLRVGFEALSWGRHIADYRDAWEVVRRVDHEAVGLILDTFHVLSRTDDLTALESIPGDRIFLVHIADAPVVKMDYLYWSRHFRCFPGQGEFPLVAFMQALRKTGYDEAISLEIFNDHLRAAASRQTAIDGHRSLILLETDAGIAAAAPPPTCSGIAFLEFAIEQEQASGLRMLFRSLGFVKVGQHRSKEVELWRQGEINLVLNTDKEGFASGYEQVHGPAICAIALSVKDAREAMTRARQFLAQPFEQAADPQEVPIPAIRGLDDGVLYFVDTAIAGGREIWDVDFVLEPLPPASAPPILTRIDYLSQITTPEILPAAVLFYRAVLGLRVFPSFDVPDPHGLMQVRVVESAERSIRVALCAPQSQGTMASRFLVEYSGSGVHQVGFRTDDVFATVRQIEANGVRLLPIPANYYDDLGARFGLDEHFLKALKEHNILYDRSDTGEFLHAYTETYAGRFFFEVIERRNYDDFGAANAAIRLAAQSRLAQTRGTAARTQVVEGDGRVS